MPRLRFFADAAGQRHVTGEDRYLFRPPEPDHALVIIGTGTIGQAHLRVAHLLGRARVVGVYAQSPHSLQTALENYAQYCDDSLTCYLDLESACNEPRADAILICTPNFTHHEVAMAAARSGKALFIEKPLATTLAHAADLVRLAATHPAVVQVGLQYRYKAQYVEALHEAGERGSLGTVKTISMSEYRPPFLDKVGQWNKFNANTGGTLLEKCCHYFDLINLLARARPRRVFASGGAAVNFRDFEYQGRKSDIDDHAFVIIDYERDIRASFTLNMFCPDFVEELVVCGDQGRLVAMERFSPHQQQPASATLALELGESGSSRVMELAYPRIIEQSGHHGATYFEHQAFMDRMDGKSGDGATALQGLWAMVVACAAQQSMASGQPVDIEKLITQHQLGPLLAP